MARNPIAFFSYVQLADKHDGGRLTELRERLEEEVQLHTGEQFCIFQDRNDLQWGQQWEERIEGGIKGSTFLIPIIIPAFFKSSYCRKEFEQFLEQEKKLNRNDLILPLIYIETPLLKDKEKCSADKVALEVSKRQKANWCDLRHEPWTTPEVGRRLSVLAVMIRDAIERDQPNAPSPKPKRDGMKKFLMEISEAGSTVEDAGSGEVFDKISEDKPANPLGGTKPLIVDQMPNRGDHTTINAAIEAALPGATILVHPGFYKEGIILGKPLEIIGDGPLEDIVVEAEGMHTVSFKTQFGRVANLTLRQAGGENWFCVSITEGRLILEGCDISSQSLACVAVRGGADPRVRRNRIYGGKQGGIMVLENGKGLIEDNDIHSNTLSGIEIREGGDPQVRRNRIHDGKQNGIMVWNNGRGLIEENDIHSNALSGVEVREGGAPQVRRNRVIKNKLRGIYVHDKGSGTFEENDLRGNEGSAWDIDASSEKLVKRNGNIEK